MLPEFVLAGIRTALAPLGRARRDFILAYLAQTIAPTARIPVRDAKTIAFSLDGPHVVYRARSILRKEPETIQWIDGFAENDILYDIGANIGVYSLYAAVVRNARVWAFEPAAVNYRTLNANIMQNGCDNRITAYCLGFADQVGATMLHSPKMGVGGTGHAVHDATDAKGRAFDAVFKQGILSFTLDGFIATFGAPVPNHIKIDVDGIEAKIIDGARETLVQPELRTVLVETNDQRGFQYIDGKLHAAGFELVGRGKDNKIYARPGTATA